MKIRKQLHKIARLLIQRQDAYLDIPSLMSGFPGVLLFMSYYFGLFRKSESRPFMLKLLDRCREHSHLENLRFSDGLSGILWLFLHLEKSLGMEINANQLVKAAIRQFRKQKRDLAEGDNVDFLHGMLGLELLFHAAEAEDLSLAIDKAMISQAHCSNQGVYWMETMGEESIINTSLAHGQAAHLSYLANRLNCLPEGIHRKKLSNLLREGIRFLKSIELNNQISRFPSFVRSGENPSASRLAWCYGDLSIATSLLYCAGVMKDAELKKFAIDLALSTCSRKSKSSSGIIDLGFCHGSSGLAHLYRYFFEHSGNESFQKTSQYWLDFTCNNLFSDGDTYLAFRGEEEGWQESLGLLDGIAGIGLSLIAQINQKYSIWQEVFFIKTIRDGKIKSTPKIRAQASSPPL